MLPAKNQGRFVSAIAALYLTISDCLSVSQHVLQGLHKIAYNEMIRTLCINYDAYNEMTFAYDEMTFAYDEMHIIRAIGKHA